MFRISFKVPIPDSKLCEIGRAEGDLVTLEHDTYFIDGKRVCEGSRVIRIYVHDVQFRVSNN